jgi:hypothetical protein
MGSRGPSAPAGSHRPGRVTANRTAGRRPALAVLATVLAAAAVAALAAGCGPAPSPNPGKSSAAKTTVVKCGTGKTAANVPVNIEVVQGHISCAAARAIEQDYATAIRSGLAPGNGGGGPLKVKGWTCQGFSTPTVLSTGKASECVRAGVKILAILPPTTSGS